MTVKVYMPKMISANLLRVLPGNSNKQDTHTFEELKKNIREQGFDESLTVTPNEDGTYTVVSGNHRMKAGMEEGMDEFPCVVRDDWDDITKQLQSVRRNYARGKINRNLFTAQIDALKEEYSLTNSVILEGMGFADLDAFAALYQQQREEEEEAYEKMHEDASSDAHQVKVIDDLTFIVSHLINKYGDTIPYSFMIVPVGGKNHLYIKTNTALKSAVQNIAAACVANNLDINVALTGIISIGLANTDFLEGHGVKEIREEANGEEDEFEIVV